jgi:small subunit ribosomal protein S8
MSVSDLIADQITVLRNAIRAGKKTVLIKRSGLLENIVDKMKAEGFIDNYKVVEDNKQGRIKLYLGYTVDDKPVMENIERVSKPGRRTYISSGDVRSVMGGVGAAIYSTSKGVLTDKEVREQGVGGELICRMW